MDKIKHITLVSSRTAMALGLSLFVLSSRAAVINVPGDYSTIQDAVTAAQAGDEIIVDGTYEENVTIDKSLSLIGDSGRIDSYNEYPAITITADDVRVSNLDIRTSGAYAIEADGQGGIVIDSCQIHGGDIELLFSRGATITNCYSGGANFAIRSMGNGYYGGTNDVITGCQVEAAFVGIYITDASVPVVISSNRVENCEIGISVGDSSSVGLNGNYVRNTESDTQPLRFYAEFSNCSVDLAGNNVSAVNDPAISVTAITLLNEGENTLNVAGHFNRFGASTAVTRTGTGTCVTDLTNNWWGKNSAPTSDVSVSPWLIMSVSPQSVAQTSGFVTISCNWFTNSASQNVSALGTLPDSQDGLFTADSAGYLVDPIYDNRVPMQISGGTSSVLYYPSASAGTVNAILDNESIAVLINH